MKSSAPRGTAQKWLAFGAIVVVAVGVSFASNAFKNHLKSSLPEPAPPETTTPTPVPALLPSADTDPDEDAPPATDPRIAPVGTPKTSLAAKPSWWTPNGSWAPQHTRLEDIYASASAPSGSLSKAFVICRGRGALANHENIHVKAKLGKMPEIEADGPRETSSAFASAPLVDLKSGDAVDIRVYARADGGLEKRIGVNAPYGGTIVAADTSGELDCVALTGEELQDRIAEDAGRADSAIARLDAVTLDPSAPEWGWPTKERTNAMMKIADVAALTGWDDVRAQKRVGAYSSAETKLVGAFVRIFETLRSSAGNQAKVGTVDLTLSSFTCDSQPSRQARCLLSLAVTNDGAAPIVWGRDVGTTVADAKGPTAVFPPEGQREAIVPAHTTYTLAIEVPWRARTEPMIAQFRVGGARGVIRLR